MLSTDLHRVENGEIKVESDFFFRPSEWIGYEFWNRFYGLLPTIVFFAVCRFCILRMENVKSWKSFVTETKKGKNMGDKKHHHKIGDKLSFSISVLLHTNTLEEKVNCASLGAEKWFVSLPAAMLEVWSESKIYDVINWILWLWRSREMLAIKYCWPAEWMEKK